jgi:hypothetical protein
LLGVHRARRAVQRFGLPQAVQVGERCGRVVVQGGQVNRAPDRGDRGSSPVEQPQRAGVIVLLEVHQSNDLVEHRGA